MFPSRLQLLLSCSVLLLYMSGCSGQPTQVASSSPEPQETGRTTLDEQSPDPPVPAGAWCFQGHPPTPQGQAIYMATVLYAVQHGELPASIDALRPYLPFASYLEDASLGLTVETGVESPRRFLFLDVPAIGAGPAPEETEVLPAELAHLEPFVGRSDGREHFLMLEAPVQEKLSEWGLSNSNYLLPSLPDPQNPIPPGKEPEESWENAHLGYFTAIVQNSNADAAEMSPTRIPPRSLNETAAHYGGKVPEAWINPYTSEPMQACDPAQPTPGDYSLEAFPDGMEMTIYFRTQDGSIGARVFGERGAREDDPMGALTGG